MPSCVDPTDSNKDYHQQVYNVGLLPEPIGQVIINDTTWDEYILEETYLKDRVKVSPFYGLQTERGGFIYTFSFEAVQSLKETQNEILSTFRFLDNMGVVKN